MRKDRVIWLVMVLVLSACTHPKSVQSKKEDGRLSAVFVQVNDVYEIAPLADGKIGGLARIATLKNQYVKKNKNTYLVMAGDFLSPSVYNSLQYQGQKIRGRQMVDALNTAGTDLAIFGNHEFDLTETELQQRINESNFQWISANAFHLLPDGSVVPFKKQSGQLAAFPAAYVLNLRDEDGTIARIGFIGLVLPYNRAAYVKYTDVLSTAKELYAQIKDSCDAVIAITHQAIADDRKLATELPGLAAIFGGHEHDMHLEKIGNIYITKAHANARTAFVIEVDIDKNKKSVSVKPELKELNQKVPLDSATDAVVRKWTKIADENYAFGGFDPKEIIIRAGTPFDARETVMRSGMTNFGRLITKSMQFACPQADVVMVNAGSVRVDDILYPPITQYDILRSLPFGGGIREVDMRGRLLAKVLGAGKGNKGAGGFLLVEPVIHDSLQNKWMMNDVPLDPDRTYRVAMSDFLLSGREANLDFLNEKNVDIVKVYPAIESPADARSDIRLAIIKYLKSQQAKSSAAGGN